MRNSLVGQRFGRWVVISFAGRRKKSLRWNCRCDCGREATVSGWCLKHGNNGGSTQCLRCGRKQGGAKRRKGRGSCPRNHVFAGYRTDARRRQIEWALSDQEFDVLTASPCRYCGGEPAARTVEFDVVFIWNGIDRIDNSKGYISGNVASCCKTCNLMKRGLTVQEFKDHIKKIYRYLEN